MFRKLLSVAALAFLAIDMAGCPGCKDKKDGDKKPEKLESVSGEYCKKDKVEVKLTIAAKDQECALTDGTNNAKGKRADDGDAKMNAPNLSITGVDCTKMEWVKDSNAIKCLTVEFTTEACKTEKTTTKAF